MDKNFQKDIAYNIMRLATEARNDLLYAHQVIGETYTMRDNYEMPLNTYGDLDKANEKFKDAIPIINEVVAYLTSAYVKCCKEVEKEEKKNS